MKKLLSCFMAASPAGCDHTTWQRHAAVEDLADELGIIIVMPDLKLSYGLDMIHGFAYFQMLTKELPEMVADYFPADLGFQMIAGVKEGRLYSLKRSSFCSWTVPYGSVLQLRFSYRRDF